MQRRKNLLQKGETQPNSQHVLPPTNCYHQCLKRPQGELSNFGSYFRLKQLTSHPCPPCSPHTKLIFRGAPLRWQHWVLAGATPFFSLCLTRTTKPCLYCTSQPEIREARLSQNTRPQTQDLHTLGYALSPSQQGQGRCSASFKQLEVSWSKVIALQLYWLQVSYFVLPELKHSLEEKKKINNWSSSLVNHHAKLTRLIKCLQFHSAGVKWQGKCHCYVNCLYSHRKYFIFPIKQRNYSAIIAWIVKDD